MDIQIVNMDIRIVSLDLSFHSRLSKTWISGTNLCPQEESFQGEMVYWQQAYYYICVLPIMPSISLIPSSDDPAQGP
jgi:hypothetical protein